MIKFRKCQGVLGGEVCSFMFLTCTVFILFVLEFASRQIKQDMEQFRVKGLQQERQHQSLLQDIDEQLEGVLSQRKANENRASIISEILDKTKTG